MNREEKYNQLARMKNEILGYWIAGLIGREEYMKIHKNTEYDMPLDDLLNQAREIISLHGENYKKLTNN